MPQNRAEKDIDEVPHRLGRFHHLGPQDRPFPAGKYEAGRYGRIDGDGKFSPFLGLGQAGCEPFPPHAEELIQSGAEARVQAGQFLSQISDQAPLGALVMRHACQAALQEVADAAKRRDIFVVEEQFQALLEAFGKMVDHRQAEFFLAPEVVVERPLGDTGLFQERIDAGGVVALPGDHLDADPNELALCGFLYHGVKIDRAV